MHEEDAAGGTESKTESSQPWRIAVVEDHLLQRRRTEQILGSQVGMQIVRSCETFPEFLRWWKVADVRQRPHLLILDLMVERGPSVDPDLLEPLIASGLKVLVLSAMASPTLVRQVLHAGVSGIVGKRDSEDTVLAAVRAVLRSGEWMTSELAGIIANDRERPTLSGQEERALVLYASGLTLQAVATAMNIKPDTAKQYLARVKAKYAAAGRPIARKVDLARVAWTDGYLDPEDGRTTPDPSLPAADSLWRSKPGGR